MLSRIGSVIVLVFYANAISAEQLTASELAVKKLEEDYWKYVENNDVESYSALWNVRFVGWPENSLTVAEVDTVADWIPKLHKELYKPDFEIIWHAIRAFGDTVVTHYHFTLTGIDPNTGEAVFINDEVQKITHTWKRDGDSWKIITGMSGDYPPANIE